KNMILATALPLLLSTDCATSTDLAADLSVNPTMLTGPMIADWKPVRREAAYLFAGQVDRATAAGAPDWTVLTVGAQINAVNRRGVHQVVFGVATEAWAEQGSFSMLTGLEATTINREPDNPWRKDLAVEHVQESSRYRVRERAARSCEHGVASVAHRKPARDRF